MLLCCCGAVVVAVAIAKRVRSVDPKRAGSRFIDYRLRAIGHIAIDGAISTHLFKFIHFAYKIDKYISSVINVYQINCN